MLLPDPINVWLCGTPTDMRKAANGLSQLVVDNLAANPQSGDLFVFYNRQRDRLKILYWHFNGFCLLQKRLEKNRFKVNFDFENKLSISERQLYRLLEGLHFINESEEKYDIFY